MIKILFIGLLFFHSHSNAQGSVGDSITSEQLIADLQKLASQGCIFIGYGSDPSPDELNKMNAILNLSKLSKDDLRSLLESENTYTRFYAFNAMAFKYPDALTESDLAILTDTSKTFMCMGDTLMDVGMTLGGLASEAYTQVEEREKLTAIKIEIEKRIEEFILENAKYPKTYESIEFSDYISHGIVDSEKMEQRNGESSYEMLHRYRIKNRAGEVQEFGHYFILGQDLSISLIEEERSNRMWGSVAQLDLWFGAVGKKLSKKERKQLNIE